jgi:hypothetical protein
MTRAELVDQVLRRLNSQSPEVHQAINAELWEYDVADEKRKLNNVPAYVFRGSHVMWLERNVRRRLTGK